MGGGPVAVPSTCISGSLPWDDSDLLNLGHRKPVFLLGKVNVLKVPISFGPLPASS